MDGVTAQRRRERTVSAFASSSKPVHFSAASSPQQQQKPLPSAAQHHFRKRVKSENTRDRPTSLSSAYLQPVQQQQRASIIGPRLPKQSHRQRVSSQETSHGFVSLNSILDTVGLPRPPPVATYQPGSRPLKSSLKESRTRFQQPHGLDNSQAASSVPHSLLDPISLDPGYSIKKPDTTQSHSYRPSNAQSVQTLASSLQRHNTISSSNHQEQYGYDQETPALSSEQSWYLLRTLVELEIEEESTKLWKLTGGLNADSVEWDSAYDFGSDDPTTTEEVFAEDPRVKGLPILRFLLRQLLEMPLIKEAGPNSTKEDRRPIVAGMDLFWHAGVSPIIRLLHEMDLSQPVDRGRSSFFSDMSDAITRGLARFIAAGLHFSDRDPAQEPTGQSTTLVDESNPLSKSQNSAALTDISESPDFNRLFFTSPYSTAQDSSDLREDWRRQFESPVTRRSAQPKLSTLHAGGSDVQSQHVSYSGSHDSPWASPEKPKLSLAQRYRQQESLPTTTASSLPASPARWPTNSNGAQVHPEDEDAGEVLAPDGDEESRRNSSASTEMFTCEEEPQTSSDNDREADVSGNQDDTVSISAVEDSFLAPGQATATYSVAITPPHSPTARQNTAVAWPSAPIEPPSLDPKDLKPTPAKEKARPPNLNLERPLPLVPGERSPLSAGPSLSASTSALPSPKKSLSGSPSFSPSSPTSQQSTVKAAQPSRRRRFTLSFSRKKPPKNLKAEISAPILIPDQTQGGEIPSPVRRLYIDGSEAKVAYMEYHDSSSATVAVPPEMALKESQNDSMPHKGHDWRWEMCTIPRVPTVKAVSWGGFNVDVVGVRESIFGGRSFILRISRPSRLDEYVARSMSDFEGLRSRLLKGYPDAYIRSLPSSKSTRKEAARLEKEAEVEAFINESHSPTSPLRNRRQSVSRFSARLRDAAKEKRPAPSDSLAPSTDRHTSTRRGTLSTLRSITPSEYSRPPGLTLPDGVEISIPRYDLQRRALRIWLADTLKVRGLPHDPTVTTFLLSNPQELNDMDLVSIRHCQVIDDHKRTERRLKAAEAGDACRLSHMLWSGLQHEVFQEDGLDAFSDALRTNEKLSQCPLRFQRTAEWLRRDLAQFLYDSLVASDVQSFSKLKSYTSQIPWFMLRATFKLTNKRSIFKRALSDLFLSRPYGSNGSLLERLLAVFLRDTRSTEQLTECRSRIGSISICEKLRKYVYSERDVKQTVRRHAELYDLPLVVTIARGGATALDQFDLERVLRAAKRWKRAEETTGSPPSGQAIKNDPHIRLILDMQLYLRLLSEARDGHQIRDTLASGVLSDPLLVCFGPLIDLCIRVNHDHNLSDFVAHIQRFCEQLISVVTSLRSRVQDPQHGVRLMNKLLEKYQEPLFTFLHTAHINDSIVDDTLAWISSVADYLRHSQQRLVHLANILPSSEEALESFATELDELVKYHRQKRDLQTSRAFDQQAGDYQTDDSITIQGDGYGRSRTEPLVETKPLKPFIGEISQCLARFRSCIAAYFDTPDSLEGSKEGPPM